VHPRQVADDIIQSLGLRRPVANFKAATFRANLTYGVVMKDLVRDKYEDLKKFALESVGAEKTKSTEIGGLDWVIVVLCICVCVCGINCYYSL